MNTRAEQHLDRAATYVAKGEEFYRKAAAEIVAAKEADPTLSNVAIGKKIDKSDVYVMRLLEAFSRAKDGEPFSVDWQSGSNKRADVATKFLSDAPAEQVTKIVEELPAARVAEITTAALGREGVTRELAKSSESTAAVFRASGRVSEEIQAENKRRTRTTTEGSSIGGAKSAIGWLVEVVGPLETAKRKLNDAYTAARDLGLDDEQRDVIGEDLDDLVAIIDWFRSYLRSGDQSFETELASLLDR